MRVSDTYQSTVNESSHRSIRQIDRKYPKLQLHVPLNPKTPVPLFGRTISHICTLCDVATKINRNLQFCHRFNRQRN